MTDDEKAKDVPSRLGPRAFGLNERAIGKPGYKGTHNRWALRNWKRQQRKKKAQPK